MQIGEQRHGAVMVIKPEGALVAEEIDAFRTRLEALHCDAMGRVVVDLNDVPFVDSSGLEVLLDVSEQMAEQGRALRLCRVNETVREVLELTDLASHFEQYDDATHAVRSFL
ncbi:MAG: STAS domain-containing protein [Phycisphaeraceae bacterium]